MICVSTMHAFLIMTDSCKGNTGYKQKNSAFSVGSVTNV